MAKKGRAALGFRAHSGWATVVAISGGQDGPLVMHRERLELVTPGRDAVRQPFHAAEGQSLERARAIVEKTEREARLLATGGLRKLLAALDARGCSTATGALLLASGRPLPDLPAILKSHAWIHAAEGELFRNALRSAASECGVALIGVLEREVWTRTARELRRPADRLQEEVGALGKAIGPPWRQDEKLAAAAALLALGEQEKAV